MTDQPPPQARRARATTFLIVVAALAAGAVLFVLLLHAPFTRSAVLGYVLPRIEREYRLQLTASRLDYNLAAMRVGLADVRLAAPHAVDEPFFTADYVFVDVPWGIVFGQMVFDDISVTNGSVVVRRSADGATNLPAGSDEPGGEPAALRINRLDINRLSVDLNDEQAVTSLWLPAIAIGLTPTGGSLRMETAGFVRTETQETAIQRIDGGARFDGRALHLSNLDVLTADGRARLSGAVTLIARDPSVDLTIAGSADATRVSRWFVTDGELPTRTVAFDGGVEGPFTAITTVANVMSDRLALGDLVLTALDGRARVTSTAADIERLEFGFAGGTVSAMGVLPLDETGSGRLSASWTRVDAAAATRSVAPGAGLMPSGQFSGDINIEGTGLALERWRGLVRLALEGGATRRGEIPASGRSTVRLDEGRWRLEGRHLVGGVAPAGVVLSGSTANSIVTGDIDLAPTGLVSLADVLRGSGLADVSRDVVTGGSIAGTLRITGEIADPVITGDIAVRELATADVAIPLIEATISGRPAGPDLDFRATAADGALAGEPFADLRTAGRIVESMVVLDEVTAAQPSTAGMLNARGTYDLDTSRYDARVEGSGWRISPTPDRPAAADLDLTFTGMGTVDDLAGAGTVTIRDAVWEMTRLGGITASFELAGRSALIKAEAPEFTAAADVQIALDTPYRATVDARATGLDLARVLQGIETPVPITGTTTLAIRADGPLESWRTGTASLEVSSLDARAGDLDVGLAGTARARYASERVYIDNLEVDAEDLRLSASGDLAAFESATGVAASGFGLLVTMTGSVDQVVRAAAAAGLTDLPVTGGSGPVALLARVTGALEAPVIAADLEAGPGSVTLRDLPPATNVRLRAHAEEGWVELREAQATYEGADISATGKAFFEPRSGDLHARATNLTAAVLRPFVDPGTLDDVTGSIDATLDLAAPSFELSGLTGELRIDRLDVRVADLPVTQRVPTRIVARDGFARVEAWEWVGQGATLDVRGQVRLEDRQAAILANGVIDLRMLTPFVRDAGMTTAGRMEPRLSITGPIDSPRIDGDVVVTDGELRLVDPRVVVSGMSMRTVLSRTSGRITALTGSINGGTLTGEGTIDYNDDGQLDLQLTSDIRGMALEFPEGLRSEIDAALGLSFVAPEPMAGRLSGTVTVVRGSYREPLAVVTGLLAASRAQQLAAASEASPLLDALALDVRVVTDEDIFVDNNYGRFQLGADLRLIGTAFAPALSGRADLREGGQLFVGRNVYTVNFGAIDFASAAAIEPNLNVEASTRAGGEDIDVAITGPAESPTVTLSSESNPDLGQAELASLLLTGRRLEDLAPGDAAFVGTQVLGNFSAEVLGFASRAVGLDTLRLGGVDNPTLRSDPTAVATELDPTTRVTFGKSLGSDVDVTFSQSLRNSDAQTWIVDYLPVRGLELRLVSDDEDLRSYGFRHDVAIGGALRTGQSAVARARADVRVIRVEIAGSVALPEARARDVLRLEPGDRFDFASWQEDRDRLEALYREERYLTARINARRTAEADGVALVYDIEAGPLASIEIAGIEASSALRERLETAWAESVFDDFLIDEATGIVRAALGAGGYLQPSVSVSLRGTVETKVLVIGVDPGPRTPRTEVRVDGVDEERAGEIRAALDASDIADNAVLAPGSVEAAATAFLRSRGHLRASVTAGAPLFETGLATLPLTVDAGDVFVISGVSFPGAQGLDAETLRGVAGVDPGAPYVPAALEEARQRLVAVYRREGFAAAAVAARPVVADERPEVVVAFEVTEGPRQVLSEIVVSGTRRVSTDVVRRSLELSEGDPLRADEVLQARSRVFNTGLFRRIDVAAEPADGEKPGTTPMRLRVTVEEWPAVRLRYGLVVAEERPEDKIEGRELVPGVSADVTRRMLFGRPIGLGTAVSLQRLDQRGRVFVNTPTFFGLPVESALIGQRSREQFQAVSLVTNRDSVTWEQRARPARNLTFSYAYTFERNHTYDTKPNESDEFMFDITVNIARLNGSVAWDSRDDPTDTTRGLFASTTTEYAPEAGGSDIRFIRQLQQAYYFRPWRGMVFASAARAGVVVPLGGQDLIVSERFFAGGSRTVRGVAEEGLGERDFFGPTGGQLMVVLNQEVRVPIYGWVRGVGFVDAGNVFGRPRDASLRDLVGSVGVGMRLVTPFALLRVDFAKTAWGAPATSGRWTFGIGQAF